jgi:hypothetical protein
MSPNVAIAALCLGLGTLSAAPPAGEQTKLPDAVRARQIQDLKWGMFVCQPPFPRPPVRPPALSGATRQKQFPSSPPPGRDTFLTYVFMNTLAFSDREPDFDDRPLTGTCFHRLTAMDRTGNESQPTPAVKVEYP